MGLTQPSGTGMVGGRIGPYELVAELGRGAMGVVYRARHTALDVEHALKVIGVNQATPDLVARFRREAEALALLQRHPNLVSIHASGSEPTAWYAMDLVAGGKDLHALSWGTPVPLARALGLVRDAARGLAALHERGLAHRDVKPANLLVDETGVLRVADMGLVRFLDGKSRLTRTGELLGTPMFMAPEAIVGEEHGPPADVYALGLVLFQLLGGRAPLEGSVIDVLSAVTDGRLPRLRDATPGVPADLEALYQRVVHHDPARRPDAAALADALDALAARTVHAGPRRDRRAALPLVGLVGLAGLVAAWLTLRGAPPAPAPEAWPAPAPARAAPSAEDVALARARALLDDAPRRADPAEEARAFAAAREALGTLSEADARKALAGARRAIVRARQGLLRRLPLEDAGEVRMLAFSPSGDRLFAACYGDKERRPGHLRVWSVPELVVVPSPAPDGGVVRACAVSPDGAWLSVARDEQVELWSTTGAPPRPGFSLGAKVRACSISSNGLVAATGDSAVAVLQTPDGRTFSLHAPGGRLYAAAFDREGLRLAAGGNEGLFVWELSQGDPPTLLDRHSTDGVAFSPDGARLAATGSTLRLWEVPRWDAPARSLAFQGDVEGWGCALGERLLAIGLAEIDDAAAPMVRVFDLRAGLSQPRDLRGGHSAADVNTCVLSPDGSLLATGDADAVVCLWSVGEPVPEALLPTLPEFDRVPLQAVNEALAAKE